MGGGAEQIYSGEARVQSMMEGLCESSQVGLFWEAGQYRAADVGFDEEDMKRCPAAEKQRVDVDGNGNRGTLSLAEHRPPNLESYNFRIFQPST